MRAFKPSWQVCCLLGVLIGASCRPDRAFMVVALSGLSAQVQTVEVRAVLEEAGLDAIERFDGLQGPNATVSLYLPPAAAGKLTVTATELQQNCSVGLGTATATVQGQTQVDVAVVLSKPSSVLCAVTVERTGDGFGIVTVEPPASGAPLSCGERCTFLGVAGTTVTLHAQVMAPGYFAKWSGPCKPSSPAGMACQVQVGTNGTKVGAEFRARSCTPGTFCDESPALPNVPVTYLNYDGVWGASEQDVWVVEGRGAILHKHGLFWSEDVIPGTPLAPADVFGINTTDIWIISNDATLQGVALHWDGRTWARMNIPTSVQLAGLWGNSSNFFLASSRDGAVLQWDGATWTRGTVKQPGVDIAGIWGTEGVNIWVGGSGLYQYNGSNTWIRDAAVNPNGFVTSVWGVGPADYWLVGSGLNSRHRVNGQLLAAGLPDEKNDIYNSVHGTSSSDVWAVSTAGSIYHYDGSAWKAAKLNPSASYNRVFANSPSDVYVVGDDGTILHYRP